MSSLIHTPCVGQTAGQPMRTHAHLSDDTEIYGQDNKHIEDHILKRDRKIQTDGDREEGIVEVDRERGDKR